jgi:hypothetical protein
MCSNSERVALCRMADHAELFVLKNEGRSTESRRALLDNEKWGRWMINALDEK